MKGTVTKREFNGMRMLKFSQLPKNGKPQKMVYKFPAEFIKEIDEEVAAYESEMDEHTAQTIAMIKKLKIKADRVEMYEFAITTAEQLIQKTQEYKNVVLDMLPPPIAESNRRKANCVIAQQKSDIARFKKEMAVK